jgi:hypothetical protein
MGTYEMKNSYLMNNSLTLIGWIRPWKSMAFDERSKDNGGNLLRDPA